MSNTMLPARINLQIREGRQNTLAEFHAEVAASHLREDGHIDHDVDVTSIIAGLARALHDQIDFYLDKIAVSDEARLWLASLRDWTFGEEA
jgi:hypothetical protein